MNILEYKGYHGSVQTDLEHNVLRGSILFIADLVTYVAETPAQLKKEFEAAVDDYLETCKELGREPKKPASGTFNVRTSSDAHRAAQVRAIEDGVSMNEVVVRALDCYLNKSREVREKRVEKHFVTVRDAHAANMLIPLAETETKEVRRVVYN